MKLFRGQPSALSLLTTLLTTGLLSSTAFAQDNGDSPKETGKPDAGKPDLSQAANSQASETAGPQPSKSASNGDDGESKDDKTSKDNKQDKTTQGATQTDNKDAPTPTSNSDAVITGATTGKNDVTITGGIAATDTGLPPSLPTDLPSIDGGFSIPTPQVPPTANAPYMQESKLPAGTVFIAVGAILGFLALAVLLWRVLTVWALKRSVKRAAMANNMQDTKTLLNFRPPAAPVYNRYSDRESTLSLANLRKSPKPTRPTTSGGAPPGQSLFFSPTAGGSSMLNPGNRGSGYLPSGYYAAGASAPGNGTGMAHLGGSGLTAREAISLSNLGPQAQGYARARSLGTTPPDSPRVAPALSPGPQHGVSLSTSTLDLTQRPGGRAPSAYLEELFDEAGAAPGHYPVNHPNYQGGGR